MISKGYTLTLDPFLMPMIHCVCVCVCVSANASELHSQGALDRTQPREADARLGGGGRG